MRLVYQTKARTHRVVRLRLMRIAGDIDGILEVSLDTNAGDSLPMLAQIDLILRVDRLIMIQGRISKYEERIRQSTDGLGESEIRSGLGIENADGRCIATRAQGGCSNPVGLEAGRDMMRDAARL